MHNLKSIDKAFQLGNAFRNISDHYKNAFSYNFSESHLIISVNGRIRFQMGNT